MQSQPIQSQTPPQRAALFEQRVPRYTSYPTAPHFHDGVTGPVFGQWLDALPEQTPLSLYLHVPFCQTLCHYCGCNTVAVNRYGPVESYVDLLLTEMDMVAARTGPRRVTHLHWGGGTPTILQAGDFLNLMQRARALWQFDPQAEIAIEIDPRRLTQDRVDALAEAGINRASLGCQDFDPQVQEAIGRIQDLETTAQVARALRAAGIHEINVDLMYGLPHQTVEIVRDSVGKALTLNPARVSLFGYAHVPWMKKHQQLIREDLLPDGDARMAQFLAASDYLLSHGYVAVGLDHFAREDDELAVQLREGRLKRNFQGYTTDDAPALIGLGASAISSLPQGYAQNAPTTPAYRKAIESGQFATARGLTLSQDDRLRRDLIERLMCDLTVDVADICAVHGRDASALMPEFDRIDELARHDLVVREDTRITVPEPARPFVRSVCAVFDQYLRSGETRHARAV
jgi:oxygen-independent coproporphyrinogen-3 oxidase